MKNTSRGTLAVVSLVTAFSLFPVMHTAYAGSLCKGLDVKACGAQAGCSWVNSYKTKKGKSINAYCRKKSAKTPGKDASRNSKLPKSNKSS